MPERDLRLPTYGGNDEGLGTGTPVPSGGAAWGLAVFVKEVGVGVPTGGGRWGLPGGEAILTASVVARNDAGGLLLTEGLIVRAPAPPAAASEEEEGLAAVTGGYNRGGLECEGVGPKLLLLLPTGEELGGISVLDAVPTVDKLNPRGDFEEESAVSAEDETAAGISKGGEVGLKVWRG
ncbi:hypothetical protein ABBQ32_010615 [Trebouxia sp. C0010 RCD-2024]